MLTPDTWAIFLWKLKKLSSNSARVTGKVAETKKWKLLMQAVPLRLKPLLQEVQVVGVYSHVAHGLVQVEQFFLVQDLPASMTPEPIWTKSGLQARQKLALRHSTQPVGQGSQELASR